MPISAISNMMASMRILLTATTALIFPIAVIFCTAAPAEAAIQLQFDYTYDSSGFFAGGSAARSTLEAVGDFYESLLGDDLLAINSNSSNHFKGVIFQPDTGGNLTLPNLYISADTVRVYVGAYDLGGSTLGRAGPGGYSISSSYLYMISRGEGEGTINDVQGITATEFAPWGGSMSIDSDSNWNLDHTDDPVWGEADLYSVILHEIGHVLGLGTANSWTNLLSGGYFTGDAVVTEHGGSVGVSDGVHWDSSSNSTVFARADSQQAAMTPSITLGTRKVFTALDVAGLDDIAWDITAYGDANLDGKIDDIDATIVAANWQQSGATWSHGDFNSDGTVDADDTALMAANWLTTWDAVLPAGSAAAAVPEPSAVALLLSALAMVAGFSHRRL